MSAALLSLKVEHLRGSVVPFVLRFEKDKNLTIVYGENATGKTTICDALEFLAKGRVGSLEDRGLGHRLDRYWPSLGKRAGDISVSLDAADSTCTARIHNGNVKVEPEQHRPRVEVLRRNQILRMLEAQPAKRYAEISRFIDITGVETSEDALRRLIESLNANRDTAVAVVAANENSIRQFWEGAGSAGKDPMIWADAELRKDLLTLQQTALALSQLRAAYQRLGDYPQKFEPATATLRTAERAAAETVEKLENVLATATNEAGELLAVLEGAKPYLKKHPNPTACPLCESNEKAANLRDRVQQRLQQFSTIQDAQKEKVRNDQVVQRAADALASMQADVQRDAQKFEELKRGHQWSADIKLPEQPAPTRPDELDVWLAVARELPASWLAFEGAAQEQRKFVDTLSRQLKTYRDNVATQQELDILLPRLRRAHEILVEERQKFTDGVLKKIAGEVGRLYEAVHPGEGLEKIRLELEAGRRASLEIGASFGGTANTPPQAYFTQSHLDTLGLCIFLTLAGMDNPEGTILVLDDVLASVDEPHVERVVEMLYLEAARFRHCVITTHYRPWKEKLRWGWLQNGQCHFVELNKWSLANGLQYVRSIPDIDRLRQLLAEVPPDPQLVCSKAGVILEASLNFLTELYESDMPRRAKGLYTLGELLCAFDRKLRQALKAEMLSGTDASDKVIYKTVVLGPIIEELHRIAQARNIFGAHFNELSFELPDADAIAFGTQVLQLVDAVVDSENGWPRKEKLGSYWANANETRRLYPLKKPV